MTISEIVGAALYLTILWVVSASGAAVALWLMGLTFAGIHRAIVRVRDGVLQDEEPGRPHPLRKHGRRIRVEPPRRQAAAKHRVLPRV
ncbi:MAG: hypothetical protein FD126_2468 [Elusimicrobia bacterium]|nr:MAG: hypothetical protein FD126_2468 [Elusimicrobiota bacterium]